MYAFKSKQDKNQNTYSQYYTKVVTILYIKMALVNRSTDKWTKCMKKSKAKIEWQANKEN